MTLATRLRIAACALFIVTFSVTTALAGDCTATAIKSDNGTYEHCQVLRGTDIQFLDKESTPEEACAVICSALTEIDQMAEESRALDKAAGLGN